MSGDPRDYFFCNKCSTYVTDLNYHFCGGYSLYDNTSNRLSKIEETLVKILAIIEKPTTDTCTWSLCRNWYEEDSWNTTCGNAFVMIEGSPKDNKYEFCPACGKPLVEVVQDEDEDDED